MTTGVRGRTANRSRFRGRDNAQGYQEYPRDQRPATGATSLLAVSEWAAGFPLDLLTGYHPVPGEGTLRRVLARVDGDALDQAVGRWLADRHQAAPQATGLRGAAHAGGRRIHNLLFPGAQQTIQLKRRRVHHRTGRITLHTAYAVTDLTAEQAPPAQLAALIRGRWSVESLHHVPSSGSHDHNLVAIRR